MASNFTIFESAVSALGANSQALSVASQNIANVNTPGYSRERILLRSAQSQVIGGIELGRGVEVRDVQRIYDQFTELNLMNAGSSSQEQDVVAQSLKQVETLFNEVGTEGLSSFVTNFLNSFQDLAGDPESITVRQNVLNKAGIVIDRFNTLSQGLKDIRESIDGQIKDRVNKINSIAEELYELNGKIISSSGSALTLRDQRNVKLRELAELTDVTAIDNSDGNFQVYIAGGMLLVNNKGLATLSTSVDNNNSGLSRIYFQVGSGQAADITDQFSTGAIKGFLGVRDTTVPGYQTTLNEFAYELATEVNSLHQVGFDLNGNTGNRFFTNLTSATDAAAIIDFDGAVLNSPNAIAASDTLASIPGGNANALSIASLQSAAITFTTSTTTFTSFYGDYLAEVGSDSANARNLAEFSKNILNQAEVQREQVSGVSLDEEQVNLIRYQAAFQAASKLVSVANNLLDLLVRLGE